MTESEMLKWGVAAVFCALLLVAAVTDIIRRRIPNWIVACLVALYALAVVLGVSPSTWPSGVGAAAIVLVVTYILFHFGVFGAGDAKLFSAVALFMGLGKLAGFVLITVMIGGLMALGVLILHPKRVMRGLTAAGRAEGSGRGIPYGVAIALGGIAAGALSLSLATAG
jgi:prepilin peptidase CpaA